MLTNTSDLNVGIKLDEFQRVTTVNTGKVTRYFEAHNLLLFQMKQSKVIFNLTVVRHNKEIKEEHTTNFLGVILDNLTSELHIDKICSKIRSSLFTIRRLSNIAEFRCTDYHLLWSNAVVFNLFCSRTPRYNFSSPLYPQSYWCTIYIWAIIYIQNKLNKLHSK
jgi:hypothetical protein